MTDAVAAKPLKVRPFDAAEHLQDEGDVAEYLNIQKQFFNFSI